MAYLKPPAFVQRVFNPLAMKFGIGGATTLTVTGRTSGKLQKIPVIPVEVDGTAYVVSTRGEAAWVKNVRAAGKVSLTRKGQTTTYTAHEVPVAERDAVLQAYQQAAGKTVETYFKTLPNAEDHPVFALTN